MDQKMDELMDTWMNEQVNELKKKMCVTTGKTSGEKNQYEE